MNRFLLLRPGFLLPFRIKRSLALALLALVVSLFTAGLTAEPAGKMRVLIDADTANEIDDLFAIARALAAPEFEMEGLTSSLWRHSGSPTSVELSQKLNEKLLDLAGKREAIPHPQGSAEPMADERTPRDSPAARHIIARAHAGSSSNKLLVLILGAPTNPASALLLDPAITEKVAFAFIDGDFRHGQWGPGIYNWKNDIHAVKAIFESKVEYFHMPAPTVSGDLIMTREEAKRHLQGRGPLWDFLIEYWETHPYYKKHAQNRMWDVALVQAFLRPSLAERQVAGAPIIHDVSRLEQFPDNPRQVTVFTRIDVPGMLADFWEAAQ